MSPTSTIERRIRELHAGDTRLAYQAMRALRTAYESERRFVEFINDELRPGGYRLLATLVPGEEQAVAAAGFRVADSLTGK